MSMNEKNDMDRYVLQLAEQMRESAQNLPDPNEVTEFDEKNLPEDLKPFADVERFLHGKAKKIGVITGIDTNAFPPPEKLTETQVTFLYGEIKQLLKAYCFYADFPKGLPDSIRYRLLRKKWDAEVVYTGEGINGLEFCDYEPSRCPFPEEFCECREFNDL